jgi:hypothetical protein
MVPVTLNRPAGLEVDRGRVRIVAFGGKATRGR